MPLYLSSDFSVADACLVCRERAVAHRHFRASVTQLRNGTPMSFRSGYCRTLGAVLGVLSAPQHHSFVTVYCLRGARML